MPKILRIINRFNLGGPTYNAAYLTKYLSNDYETLLIGGSKDETEESSTHILDNLGVNYTILPELQREINFRNDKIAYKKIKQLIADFKPDIVHTHASKAGAIGRLAASEMHVPVILHTFHGHVFHSYFSKPKTFVYKSIERYLAKKSTKIIAISEKQKYELSEIHKITDASKIEVIPLGFDLKKFTENQTLKRKQFRQKYGLNDQHIAVGIIGRLVPIKNHALFIEAVEQIAEIYENVVFFIIGGGELYQTLIETARNKNIELALPNDNYVHKKLIFTSWIKNVDEVLSGLDIVTLTSLNEGTPVSLIEAQAAAKPIVSTNVGGIADIIPENTNAVLLNDVSEPNQFISNLREMINRVKNNHINTKELSKYALDKFHYNRLVKDMENLYNELLGRKI
jgi:glycosyltransferase involved in cell wall biosynthesis